MENSSEGIWSKRDKTYNELTVEDRENRKGYKQSSSLVPLALQLFSVSLSLILLLIIGFRLLFLTQHP